MESSLFKNDTVNQHFISQVEQRLNALNPAAKNRNQRICEFESWRAIRSRCS